MSRRTLLFCALAVWRARALRAARLLAAVAAARAARATTQVVAAQRLDAPVPFGRAPARHRCGALSRGARRRALRLRARDGARRPHPSGIAGRGAPDARACRRHRYGRARESRLGLLPRRRDVDRTRWREGDSRARRRATWSSTRPTPARRRRRSSRASCAASAGARSRAKVPYPVAPYYPRRDGRQRGRARTRRGA